MYLEMVPLHQMNCSAKGPWTHEEEAIKEELLKLARMPENQECADCSAKAPRWAVWSEGVFVCIRCAGIHRETDSNKVKSIGMDRWKRDMVDKMIGNGQANKFLLHNLPRDM